MHDIEVLLADRPHIICIQGYFILDGPLASNQIGGGSAVPPLFLFTRAK